MFLNRFDIKSDKVNKILGILFLVGWVSGEMLRITGKIPITLMDVAMMFIIAEILASKWFGKAHHETGYSFCAMKLGRLGGFGIIGVISWLAGLRLFSIGESIPGLLYLVRILGYLLVIVNAKELFYPVKKWIYLALITFVVLGLGQYILLPDTRFLLQYGWDEHYHRLIGTVLDPNYMGAMLGVILIWSLYKLRNRLPRPATGLPPMGRAGAMTLIAFLSLVGLVLTYSRSSWIATGTGVGTYVIARSLRRGNLQRDSHARDLKSGLGMTVIVILITFGTFLIAPKPGGEGVNIFRTFSIEQRMESWRKGIAAWQEYPWLGVGFNNYAEEGQEGDHSKNAPSNSWILILATVGVIGVIGLIAIGIRGIWGIEGMWLGITILISVHAIFNNTLFYTPVLGLLALIRAASEE